MKQNNVMLALSRTLAALSVAFCVLLGGLSSASAHPDIEQAKKLAKQLELEPALIAYQHALDSNELTYEELVELLSERVLLLHGLKRQLERDADLEWLCAIAPEYELGMRAPPELQATFNEIRARRKGPLGIKLSYELTGSLEAHAKLLRAPSLGGRVRISVREAGGKWRSELSDTLWQVAIPGQRLELYAEALALGGVVVAHDHTAQDPLRVTVGDTASAGAPVVAVPLNEPLRDDGERWGKRNRGWLITGGVVLVAAAAVVGVLMWRDNKDSSGDDANRKTTVAPAVQF